MKIFEFDERVIAAKMQALIDDPNTDSNTKMIAKKKLQSLKGSAETSPFQFKSFDQKPVKTTVYSFTNFGSTKRLDDYDKVFIAVNRVAITFADMVSAVKSINASHINFDDGTADGKAPSIVITIDGGQNNISEMLKNSVKSSKFSISSVNKEDGNTYRLHIQ